MALVNQGGSLLLRNGALATGAACCCSKCSGPCPTGVSECAPGCGCKDSQCVPCSGPCDGENPCPEGCVCVNGECVSGCVCFTGYEVEITYPEVTCPEAGGGVSYHPPFTFGGSYYFVSEDPSGGGCLLRIAGGATCAVESEGVYTECTCVKEWAWTVDCSDGEPTLVAVGEDDPPWSCGCLGQQDACDPSQCTIPKPTVSVRPIPPNPFP